MSKCETDLLIRQSKSSDDSASEEDFSCLKNVLFIVIIHEYNYV